MTSITQALLTVSEIRSRNDGSPLPRAGILHHKALFLPLVCGSPRSSQPCNIRRLARNPLLVLWISIGRLFHLNTSTMALFQSP